MKSILIIDDDDELRSILALELGFNNYLTYEAIDGKDGMLKLKQIKADIVLLDLELPDINGKNLINEIRNIDNNVVLIIITANTCDNVQIELLNQFVDEFLIKPFSIEVLHARIQKAILLKNINKDCCKYQSGNFFIDYENQIIIVNGKTINLTFLEFRIVELLTRSAGKVLTYEIIGQKIWDDKYLCNIDTLRVEMLRIRQKIEKDPINPEFFKCHYKQGYSFQPCQ